MAKKYLIQYHVSVTAECLEDAEVKAEEFIAKSSIIGFSCMEYEDFNEIVDYLAVDDAGEYILNDSDHYVSVEKVFDV